MKNLECSDGFTNDDGNSELETMLGYAELFLDRARSSISIEEFRIYIRNISEDVSTLTNAAAASRISVAVATIKQCDYVFRKHPNMKDSVILPTIENLVEAIRKESRAA